MVLACIKKLVPMLNTGLAVGEVGGAHVLPEVGRKLSINICVTYLITYYDRSMYWHLSARTRTDTVLVQAKLLKYLRTAIENFPDVDDLIVQQFKHGQSNPTYLLQVGILVRSYACC